jgi:hypothetical protein
MDSTPRLHLNAGLPQPDEWPALGCAILPSGKEQHGLKCEIGGAHGGMMVLVIFNS